jgi:hypothetical protein
MDPRAGLDDLEKRNSWPYRDSNSDPSVVQPVASRYTDWAIPAPPYHYQVHTNLINPTSTLSTEIIYCTTAVEVSVTRKGLSLEGTHQKSLLVENITIETVQDTNAQ